MAKGEIKALLFADGIPVTAASSAPVAAQDYVDLPEGAAPEAPAADTQRIYAGTDGKLYKKGSDDIETEVGSGASGSGEINLLSNPSGETDTTGWTASGTATVTRVSTGGPLDPAIPTALRFDAGSADDYIEAAFTVPEALATTKLKVEWYQEPESGAATGEWKLEVYKAGVEIALDQDSSGNCLIANNTGRSPQYTFMTGAAGSDYAVRAVRVTGSNHLDVTSIVVGPGVHVQVTPSGPETAYSPTITGMTYDSGKVTFQMVNGSSMRIKGSVNSTGVVSSSLQIALPSGYTVDTSNLQAQTLQDVFGRAWMYDTSASGYFEGAVKYLTSTTCRITAADTGSSGVWSASFPATWANTDKLIFDFIVPIAEWAGSGTVNMIGDSVIYANARMKYTSNAATVYNTGDVVKYEDLDFDLPSAKYSTATGLYAVPRNGQYVVNASLQINTTLTAAAVLRIFKNSTFIAQGRAATSGANQQVTVQGLVNAVAGDTISIQLVESNSGSVTTDTTLQLNYLEIFALSDFTAGQAVGFGLATQTSSGLIPSYVKGSFTPALTKSGGSGTLGTATVALARYVKVGSVCHVELNITPITVSTNTVTLSFTLPFAAKSATRKLVNAVDNSTTGSGRIIMAAGSATATVAPNLSSTSWAVSAASSEFYASFSYEIDE